MASKPRPRCRATRCLADGTVIMNRPAGETTAGASGSVGYSCLAYRTRNIGDMIQTMALTRLLPRMAAVYRHRLNRAPEDRIFVVNGFLERDLPPRGGADCFFAGISGPYMRHELYLDWLRRSPWPVGARDPLTHERLLREGIAAEMVGCATLTLPRYDGPRQGVVSVDVAGPGERVRHDIPRTLSLAEQWEQAARLLERYRTSEAVYTSRLHVALPCLAFGTPVWIARPEVRGFPGRFSLLEEMGVPFEELVEHDTAPQRERYLRHFRRHLGLAMESAGDPVIPLLSGTDRLQLSERCRFLLEDGWHALQQSWGVEGRRLRWVRWQRRLTGWQQSLSWKQGG